MTETAITSAAGLPKSEDWRADLVRLLLSPDRADWSRAQALRLSHLPSRLCHYYRPTPYSFASLDHGSIWLANPIKFNDLHDTSLTFDMLKAIDEMLAKHVAEGKLPLPAAALERLKNTPHALKELDAIFSEFIAQEHGEEVGAKAKDFFGNYSITQTAEASTMLTKRYQSATKVACFCEAFDDPLLWAHYSDNHAGFCVEYPIGDVKPTEFIVHWMWPVVYGDERFSVNAWIKNVGIGIPPIFLPTLAAIHKATKWAYEREWRIIDQTGDPVEGREFLMPRPTRIFLGHRAEAVTRAKVMALTKVQSIPLLEMTPDATTYKLTPTPIEP